MFLDPQKQEIAIALFAILLTAQAQEVPSDHELPAARDATYANQTIEVEQRLPVGDATVLAAGIAVTSPLGVR